MSRIRSLGAPTNLKQSSDMALCNLEVGSVALAPVFLTFCIALAPGLRSEYSSLVSVHSMWAILRALCLVLEVRSFERSAGICMQKDPSRTLGDRTLSDASDHIDISVSDRSRGSGSAPGCSVWILNHLTSVTLGSAARAEPAFLVFRCRIAAPIPSKRSARESHAFGPVEPCGTPGHST